MAVDLVQELIKVQINPKEKFDKGNLRHLAVVTIAAIPLTSILIIMFVVAIVRLKASFNLPFF